MKGMLKVSSARDVKRSKGSSDVWIALTVCYASHVTTWFTPQGPLLNISLKNLEISREVLSLITIRSKGKCYMRLRKVPREWKRENRRLRLIIKILRRLKKNLLSNMKKQRSRLRITLMMFVNNLIRNS